jgi:putative transposase
MALEKMLAGLSSQRYTARLEPAGQAVRAQAASTSKSAVSRRFVAATETALAEPMSRRLDDLDLVVFMVDGVHFGEHTCVVALGIGIDGTKQGVGTFAGSDRSTQPAAARLLSNRQPPLADPRGHGVQPSSTRPA